MDSRRDGYEASIRTFLPLLGFDELRVVDKLVSRLIAGREQYGELDIASDKRDFQTEAAEELQDATVYMMITMIARDDARRAQLERDAAREIAEMDETAPRPKSPPERERIDAQLVAVAP